MFSTEFRVHRGIKGLAVIYRHIVSVKPERLYCTGTDDLENSLWPIGGVEFKLYCTGTKYLYMPNGP